MNQLQNNTIHETADIKRMFEEIVGTKWTLGILNAVREGPMRPCTIKRQLHGISTKVMNNRLRVLINYNLVNRALVDNDVRHVIYQLTDFGARLAHLLDVMKELQCELEQSCCLLPPEQGMTGDRL